MGDPMDLGGFMQNFVLKNPFKELQTVTDSCKQPPITVSNCSALSTTHVSTNTTITTSSAPVIPVTSSSSTSLKHSLSNPAQQQMTGVLKTAAMQEVTAPEGKAHVGSNLTFAMYLKQNKVAENNVDLQQWLWDHYKYIPGFNRLYPVKELLAHVNKRFPDISSMVLSRVIKFSFPSVLKVINKSGYFYEGLVRRPTQQEIEDTYLQALAVRCLHHTAVPPRSSMHVVDGIMHWMLIPMNKLEKTNDDNNTKNGDGAKLDSKMQKLLPKINASKSSSPVRGSEPGSYRWMIEHHRSQMNMNLQMMPSSDEDDNENEVVIDSVQDEEMSNEEDSNDRTDKSLKNKKGKRGGRKRRYESDEVIALSDTEGQPSNSDRHIPKHRLLKSCLLSKSPSIKQEAIDSVLKSVHSNDNELNSTHDKDNLLSSDEMYEQNDEDYITVKRMLEENSVEDITRLQCNVKSEPVDNGYETQLVENSDETFKTLSKRIQESHNEIIENLYCDDDASSNTRLLNKNTLLKNLEESQKQNEQLNEQLIEERNRVKALQGQLAERDLLLSKLAENFFDLQQRFLQVADQFKKALNGTVQLNINNNDTVI